MSSNELKRGIELPDGCFCHEDTCQPLSQLISSEGDSFLTVCRRINYKPTDERDADDKYRVRFKNDLIDDEQNYDKRDLIDTVMVLSRAISIIENEEQN